MPELLPTASLAEYLKPTMLVDVDARQITAFAAAHLQGDGPEDVAARAFAFVRDEVAHSWDARGRRVTRTASDALAFREGICYPKSHLLAALLRAVGIPTALCYQRLTLFDDDRGGHAVHSLNAVFLRGAWHRLDARGNKPDVDARFSLDEERLAFPVRPGYGEVDYVALVPAPHETIVETLLANDDAIEMYLNRLPDRLDLPS